MERLAYQNRFVRELVQNLETYNGASCEGTTPQVISGEDNVIILRVSLDEWIKLLSSVFTGADICYPDESDSVRWTLLRAVECPMDLCALIAECIANSEETRQAIRDLVTSDPDINQYITNTASYGVLSAENRGQDLLQTPDCDPDKLFNQCSVLVQLLHDLTEDFFEAVEVGTNALERASIVASGVPVVGQVIPIDELISFADQLIEEIQEDYIGAYDEALYDEIRCALFCATRDDCTLSLDGAIAFYETKLGEAIPDDPISALQAVIGFLNVGDFGTDAPVYALHLLMLALIRVGEEVLGVDFGVLAVRVLAAADDGNNDWLALCSDCVVPVEWVPQLLPFQPGDVNTGEAVDNGDGTVTFTAGFSYGAYRIQKNIQGPFLCFMVDAIDYGTPQFPNSIDCNGVLSDSPPIVGNCYQSIVAADFAPFSITMTYSVC